MIRGGLSESYGKFIKRCKANYEQHAEKVCDMNDRKLCRYRGIDYFSEGKKWLRIIDEETGEEWDEPITGWEIVHTLVSSKYYNVPTYYRHLDKRCVLADWSLLDYEE